jgi:hypothetical protein
VDALLGVLRELALYSLVVLVFFGPIEAFLRFRLWRATRHGAQRAYLALSDPWVTVVVALAGAGTIALVTALS